MRVRRFTLVVYHRGHVAWRSDRLFPGREARRDFSQRGSRVRLERWQPTLRHAEHVVFLGGGARVRTVAAWELQAAALELEGQQVPASAAGAGEPSAPAVATTAVPLDIAKLLSDDEIRGVTGYVGKFEDGKLADLPTTEFYDSRHFKAAGKPESYDVGLRVWRLGTAAAEVQFRKLMSTLPEAKTTDEVGDASFRARSGGIAALVYLVRERGVVVSMTCGGIAVHGAGAAGQAGQAGRIAPARAAARDLAGRAGGEAGGDAMKVTRVAAVAALGLLAHASAARAYDPATTHAGLTERAALASQLHRVLARALSRPLGLFEPVALSLDDLPQAAGAVAGGASGGARPVGGWQRGAGRRRAGARLGDCGVGHRVDARGARPVLLLRPGSRVRPVAVGRGGVAGQHAGPVAGRGRRLSRAVHRHAVQHDRAPVDRVAARARKRRRARRVSRRAGGGDRRRPPAAPGNGARAGVAGAGRRADGPRGCGRAGARPQRFPAVLSRRRGGRARSIGGRRSSGSSRRPTGAWACRSRSRPSGVRR